MPDLPRVAVTTGGLDGRAMPLMRRIGGATHEDAAPDDLIGVACRLPDAQVAVLPYELSSIANDLGSFDPVIALLRRNQEAGLRTLCFLRHDTSTPMPLADAGGVVWRESMVASLSYIDEFLCAAEVEDPHVELGKAPSVLPWQSVPRVGFMGQNMFEPLIRIMTAESMGERAERLRRVTGLVDLPQPLEQHIPVPQPVNIGAVLRNRALAVLRASSHVACDATERERFHDHHDADDVRQHRDEFLEHLVRTPYNLCIRGAGNYAYRLFETMAAGRIPVVLDTEIVLPCSDVIDWRESVVWVPLAGIHDIDRYVVDFHDRLGPDGFRERQERNRALYLDYLSPSAFPRYAMAFSNRHGYFREPRDRRIG